MERTDDSAEDTAGGPAVRTGPGQVRPAAVEVSYSEDGLARPLNGAGAPLPLVPSAYTVGVEVQGVSLGDKLTNAPSPLKSPPQPMIPSAYAGSAFVEAIASALEPMPAHQREPQFVATTAPMRSIELGPLPSIAASIPISLRSPLQPARSTELPRPPRLNPTPPRPPEVPPETPSVVPQSAPVAAPLRADVARTPIEPAAPAVPAENRSATELIRKGARFVARAASFWLAAILMLIVAFRFVNPPVSSRILQQRLAGQDIIQNWVPLEDISPQIVRAVLLSEDGRFCQHRGVDFEEMQAAIDRARDGIPRGASTISMQVIKNLFLWPSKSYVRKAIEIPLTFAMELVWPKRRIMEIYLNIAEWGPGIFGVEAASRFHFDKAARRLNEREAAQLAVALPNPYSRDAGDPGPKTQRLAGDIQDRMRGSSPYQTACVIRAGKNR